MQPILNTGEIWRVKLTDTVGNEQMGERPAIVVTYLDNVKMATVIPCTSKLDASRFPYTLVVKKSSFNGLPQDSVALIFQQRCVNSYRFLSRYGEIEPPLLDNIKTQLRDFLGLAFQASNIE